MPSFQGHTGNPSPTTLQKILISNSTGRSIYLRAIFSILFFFSLFILIGVYNFVDGSPRNPPSPKCIVLLSYLSIQMLISLAGMALPWTILLYPFRRVLEGTRQDPERQAFSYEKNLDMLDYHSAEPPLMKRTFTVLKTKLKPTNSFRVIGARKGMVPAAEIITITKPNPRANQSTRLNSERSTNSKPSRNPSSVPRNPSSVSRNPSSVSRNPSSVTRTASTGSKMSGRPRGGSQNQQSILRITHPLESVTVHQANNKLCGGLDYVSVSVTRKATGASDRSYRTQEPIDPQREIANALRKLEGLSTIGEDQSSHAGDKEGSVHVTGYISGVSMVASTNLSVIGSHQSYTVGEEEGEEKEWDAEEGADAEDVEEEDAEEDTGKEEVTPTEEVSELSDGESTSSSDARDEDGGVAIIEKVTEFSDEKASISSVIGNNDNQSCHVGEEGTATTENIQEISKGASASSGLSISVQKPEILSSRSPRPTSPTNINPPDPSGFGSSDKPSVSESTPALDASSS